MKWNRAIIEYFQYYRLAKTIFDIHSPYAARLVKAYLSPNFPLPKFISDTRSDLYRNKTAIAIEDHGAGSRIRNRKKTVSSIARGSMSRSRQLKGLHQLCIFHQPRTILELGSSFGLSAWAMQSAVPNAKVFTIEGDPTIAGYAQDLFDRYRDNYAPKLFHGRFSEVLPGLVESLPALDLIFIDGDHTLKATLENLNTIMPRLHNGSLVLIHDIHWSQEMNQAWLACQEHERVRMTIDFFDLGILIFKSQISEKQHFSVLPYWQKPWRIGLFV